MQLTAAVQSGVITMCWDSCFQGLFAIQGRYDCSSLITNLAMAMKW